MALEKAEQCNKVDRDFGNQCCCRCAFLAPLILNWHKEDEQKTYCCTMFKESSISKNKVIIQQESPHGLCEMYTEEK